MSSSSSDDEEEDEQLLRRNAAFLAHTLLSRDADSGSGTADPLALYEALCFDYPEFSGINLDQAVPALAKGLRNGTMGLSPRLVEGVLYVLQQQQHSSSSSDATTTVSTSTTKPQMTFLAQLAWTVLIQVPLACLEELQHPSNGMDRVRVRLGSYQGTAVSSSNDDKMLAEQQQHASLLQRSSNNNDAIAQDLEARIQALELEEEEEQGKKDDNNNMEEEEEIWASEEDPSDYDYGEGIPPMPSAQDFDWNHEMIDAKSLMQPNPDLTLAEVHTAIASLLRQATYSNLARMFTSSSSTKSYNVVKDLTSLSVRLLLPQPSVESTPTSLHASAWVPLNLLRDAAIDREMNSTTSITINNHSLSSSYLRLIQLLLQEKKQNNDPTTTTTTMPPSIVCGMHALSAWCQSILTSRSHGGGGNKATSTIIVQWTRDAILEDMMDDVTAALQASMDHSMNIPMHHLQSWALPMVEVFSGVSAQDGRSLLLNNNNHTSTTNVDRRLLESGFASQMGRLLGEATPISSTLRLAWVWLCVRHPMTIGKYTWRVPGLVHQLIKPTDPERLQAGGGGGGGDEVLSCLLWNLFGSSSHLASNGTTRAMRTPQGQANGSTAAKSTTTTSSLDTTTSIPTAATCLENARTCCRAIFLSSKKHHGNVLVLEDANHLRNVEWLWHACQHSEWLQQHLVPLMEASWVQALLQVDMTNEVVEGSSSTNDNNHHDDKDKQQQMSYMAKQRTLYKQWNHVISSTSNINSNGESSNNNCKLSAAFRGSQSKTD